MVEVVREVGPATEPADIHRGCQYVIHFSRPGSPEKMEVSLFECDDETENHWVFHPADNTTAPGPMKTVKITHHFCFKEDE